MAVTGRALYEVFRYVRPLHLASAKAVTRALASAPISMAMRAVVECLYDAGPRTVPQVARALWLPRQVVQRLADELVELRLLEWRTNPAHKRSKLAVLTPAGQTLFAQIHAAELATLERIAGDLAAEEVAACVRVLARLTAEVREVAREASSAGDGRQLPFRRRD